MSQCGSVLADLFYPGRSEPVGVLDKMMPPALLAAVRGLAPQMGLVLAGPPNRMLDCRLACKFWHAALLRHGIQVVTLGGDGIDDEVFVDYQIVPLDRRSGYREADREVHRHYWLSIGEQRQLLDPTAHQFDGRGGVSLSRYVIDGVPVYDPMG